MERDILLIALGHKIHVGKDTAARGLIEHHGFMQLGFGDEVKEEVLVKFRRTLKAIVFATISLDVDYPVDLRWNAHYDQDEAWWTRKFRYMLWILKPPIIRSLLQEYATEVRRTDNPEYWIQALERRVQKEYIQGQRRFVITDLRFRNEADWIHHLKGICIQINRPSLLSSSTHSSETELDDWDGWNYSLLNESTPEVLQTDVCGLFVGHMLPHQ